MKKWFSYLLPYRLKQYESPINGVLEINISNGQKTLDTLVSNYSYGSLQKVLQVGLQEIGFNADAQSVLVLGMGAGSVVETMRRNFHSRAVITLVDIDPVIADIARNEFGMDALGPIEFVVEDAWKYLHRTQDKFDFIVVDLFIGNQIPAPFLTEQFIDLLDQHLHHKGKIVYNTMRETMDPQAFNILCIALRNKHYDVHVKSRVEGYNDLILAKK